MRKLAAGIIAVVALVASPATAEPVPTPPCETSAEYGALGLAGKHEDVTPKTTPSVGHDIAGNPYNEDSVTRYRYRIDLSGSAEVPDAAVATVRLVLNWDNRSDFDLYVYDAAGSQLGLGNSFNIQSGVGRETVTLAEVPHCTDLRVEVVNYAGLPNSVVDLDVTVLDLWNGVFEP